MDFSIYPDTWIRDLPLLSFGKGAYLANRATLGTNIALSDGRILVDAISIGERALVGHLAVVAPGSMIEAQAEIGVGAAVGIRTRIRSGALVQPCGNINHRAEIGSCAVIGTGALVDLGAKIGDGVHILAGSRVPVRAKIMPREAADRSSTGTGDFASRQANPALCEEVVRES